MINKEKKAKEEPEDVDLEMETGKKDEDPDTKKGREHLVEDDEMTPAEEAFMEGEEAADEDKGEPPDDGREE